MDARTIEWTRPGVTSTTTRGACRLLHQHGWSVLVEMRLANGRRADIVGLSTKGEFVIVEVKSCAADYLSDHKWSEYQPYCDHFYFALPPDGPTDLVEPGAGLIVSDAYGGEFLRRPAGTPLAPARRRTMLLDFAQQSAGRLRALLEERSG